MAYFRCVGDVGGGAVLTLTYSSEFYGQTITATNGTKTVTKVAPSTGTMEITLPESGTWVISCTVSGSTYTTTVEVDLDYTATLEALPDGSTVLPTDDIQTWLRCAGIRDKTTYTTLADVLNDVDTFIALCADSNACDYMARSTNWASGVTADSTAMLIVGKYNYCANALLGNSTWASAICGSSYADSVISALVPTMTSDTTPSGQVVYSSQYTGQEWWRAFGSDASSLSSTATAESGYVGYKFTSPQRVVKVTIKLYNRNSVAFTMNVQGSNTGNNDDWHDVATNLSVPAATVDNEEHTYDFGCDTEYLYWRIKYNSPSSSSGYSQARKLQFYGRTPVSQTYTLIHSAVEDSIFYMNEGTPVALCTIASGDTEDVDMEAFKGQTLTLVSTVAKDPDNLSNDFTMPIRITPNITEIYLMPLGELYWWGHKGATLDIASTASGWTYSGTFLSPSYQKNYADCDSYNAWNIICFTTKNAVHSASKVCAIGRGIRKSPSDHYFDVQGRTSKTFNNGASGLVNGTTTLDVTTMAKIENDVSSGTDFYPVANTAGNQCYVYAVWYEV